MTSRFKHLFATLPPNLLDQFYKNIEKQRHQSFIQPFLEKSITNPTVKGILAGAFDWAKTEEGYQFWHDVAYKPWEPQTFSDGQMVQVYPSNLSEDGVVQLADPIVFNEPIKAEAYAATEPTRAHSSIPHQLNDIVEILMFTFPDDELLHPLMDRFDPNYYPIKTNDGIKTMFEKYGGAFLQNSIRDKFVSNAFVWDDTPEGGAFWQKFAETGIYDWSLAKTTPETVITIDPSQLPPASDTIQITDHGADPTEPIQPTVDLSDMHRQIFIGAVNRGVGSECAIGCADSAVEEYRKYLNEKRNDRSAN